MSPALEAGLSEILRNLSMRYNAGGDLPFLNNLRTLLLPDSPGVLNHAFGRLKLENCNDERNFVLEK